MYLSILSLENIHIIKINQFSNIINVRQQCSKTGDDSKLYTLLFYQIDPTYLKE